MGWLLSPPFWEIGFLFTVGVIVQGFVVAMAVGLGGVGVVPVLCPLACGVAVRIATFTVLLELPEGPL